MRGAGDEAPYEANECAVLGGEGMGGRGSSRPPDVRSRCWSLVRAALPLLGRIVRRPPLDAIDDAAVLVGDSLEPDGGRPS